MSRTHKAPSLQLPGVLGTPRHALPRGPNRCVALLLLLLLAGTPTEPLRAMSLAEVMPRSGDFTSMWWAGATTENPVEPCTLRHIRTGRYLFELDTRTARITRLGPVAPGADDATVGRAAHPAPAGNQPPTVQLLLTANGKVFRCRSGGERSRFSGPRLIESGRFFQRIDITDLVFTADDGEQLNVEARFEAAAWPDRLGLLLAARPGRLPIPPGEESFGKIGGGFGLDGSNHLEFPHHPALDPGQFTLAFWAFVPRDHCASKTNTSWLVCKNHNEAAPGNFGITLQGNKTQARMNIGGGRDGQFVVEAGRGHALRLDSWNHLAMSYDGDLFRFYLNGRLAGELEIGRPRTPGNHPLAFGRRADNSGDGYHFRGVVDEIQFHQRPLPHHEIRHLAAHPGVPLKTPPPARIWGFRADGRASETKLSEQWRNAALEIRLSSADGSRVVTDRWQLPETETWTAPQWTEAAISIDPTSLSAISAKPVIRLAANEIPSGTARPVDFDPKRGWHRVNLDGIVPVAPAGSDSPSNDAVERVKLVVSNPTGAPQVARLLFEKTAAGFRQRIGSPITGMSAVLRDPAGNPTGIPVQLSKNWHNRPEGRVYSGTWFHGFTQIRLPAGTSSELELTICYGHWGGVAAASHAQLSLVGWGGNQLWDQSALGSWGESICYDPEQAQAGATITDVRPVMVASTKNGERWNWTTNVGGGDFFLFCDPEGNRVTPADVRTTYHRQGPCLTEVTYSGHTGGSLRHDVTVSLGRTDDLVRGTYRLRMQVDKVTEFSRFVIFQVGSDTYRVSRERKMAVGNEGGVVREWNTRWGGDTYRTEPLEGAGRIPWASLHEAVRSPNETAGAWANRGLVIRSWKARLGGKEASPWFAERGVGSGASAASTMDIVPPPGLNRLQPGDFVEATIEHIIMPQFAADYYGPNGALRAALESGQNTWRMIHREATGNNRKITSSAGTLEHSYPDVRVRAEGNRAAFTVTGGLGYVPITVTGLGSHNGHVLTVDRKPLDQSVHGNDFWQTDYDPQSRTWSRTYNIPRSGAQSVSIRLTPSQ